MPPPDGASPLAGLAPLLQRAALPAALVIFLLLGLRQAETTPFTAEEVELHPRPSPGLLVTDDTGAGGLVERPTCDGARAVSLVVRPERPLITLCVGTRGYPLLVTPYYSGVASWPLEAARPLVGDDPIARRKVALVFGLLSLVLMHRLVRRFAGAQAAAIGVLATAGSAFFVALQSFQMLQETVPWMLLTAALVVLCEADRPPGARVSTLRLALGALLLGATGLANLKYLALAVPMLGAAWLLRLPFTRPRPGQALVALLVLALPLAPLLARAIFLPELSLSQGRSVPFSAMLTNLLDVDRLLRAAWFCVAACTNGLQVFRDGAAASPGWLPSVVAAAGLGYVVIAGAVVLVRREGDPLLAMLAAYALGLWGLVAVVYQGFPPNPTPLQGCFGFCLGLAAARFARALPSGGRPSLALAGAAVLAWASLVPGTAAGLGGFGRIPLPVNVHALTRTAAYLQEHPEGGPVVTVEPLLSRVVDALSGDTVRTLPAHALMNRCSEQDPAGRKACRAERLRSVLVHLKDAGPFRVLVPVAPPEIFRPGWNQALADDEAELLEGAAACGLAVIEEAVFATREDVPVARLLRIAPLSAFPSTEEAGLCSSAPGLAKRPAGASSAGFPL